MRFWGMLFVGVVVCLFSALAAIPGYSVEAVVETGPFAGINSLPKDNPYTLSFLCDDHVPLKKGIANRYKHPGEYFRKYFERGLAMQDIPFETAEKDFTFRPGQWLTTIVRSNRSCQDMVQNLAYNVEENPSGSPYMHFRTCGVSRYNPSLFPSRPIYVLSDIRPRLYGRSYADELRELSPNDIGEMAKKAGKKWKKPFDHYEYVAGNTIPAIKMMVACFKSREHSPGTVTIIRIAEKTYCLERVVFDQVAYVNSEWLILVTQYGEEGYSNGTLLKVMPDSLLMVNQQSWEWL